MTADDFRALALDLPATIESAHMKHPDFRVGGKIFATLAPREAWGTVKLTPEQQRDFMREHPGAFEPSAGAWGRKGWTKVILAHATKKAVRPAIVAAWRNIKEKA
jgi:predicted DNA-binding protein (MmcQ/YjbR family)